MDNVACHEKWSYHTALTEDEHINDVWIDFDAHKQTTPVYNVSPSTNLGSMELTSIISLVLLAVGVI